MMPVIFSYGSLQLPEIQLATYGRLLDGRADALVGFEGARVKIEDPAVAARVGATHHANVVPAAGSVTNGSAFEITDDELLRTDAYEAEFQYERIPVRLRSGTEAWVYVNVRR